MANTATTNASERKFEMAPPNLKASYSLPATTDHPQHQTPGETYLDLQLAALVIHSRPGGRSPPVQHSLHFTMTRSAVCKYGHIYCSNY